MKHWCAYQERSHFEARKKLSQLGATKEETEGIISDLISGDYLNEERFACAFARGKFRIKFWGKVKIRAALRQHGVSEPNIAKALASID